MEPGTSDIHLIKGNLTDNTLLEEIFVDVNLFHLGLSVDCVILGFHEGCLKVLLLNIEGYDKWLLPGAFVYKDEDVDAAAYRLVNERVGIKDVFLKQFGFFGDSNRTSKEEHRKLLSNLNITEEAREWFSERFVTAGYCSLVQYSKIKPIPDNRGESFKWFKLNNLPLMYGDHENIIKKAIETLRRQIGYVPIGYELLPEKFTLPELRTIYEAIVGHEIDRRNFQRKMLSIGLVYKLNESRKGRPCKAPILYSFAKEKYEAVKNGTLIADLRILTF